MFSELNKVLGPDDRGTASITAWPGASGEPGAAPAHEAPLDEFGEFRMGELEAGRYQLTLRLSQHELVLPAFDVGPAGPAPTDSRPA